MRKIIAAMVVSVDGFIEGPNGELDVRATCLALDKPSRKAQVTSRNVDLRTVRSTNSRKEVTS